VIVLAVRWYLRFGLSYRDVEELLAERGIEADHVTIYRWVQRFTPFLGRGRPPLPARHGRPLAGGRNVREGRRAMAVRAPSDRPVRARSSTSLCRPTQMSRQPAGSSSGPSASPRATPVGGVTDRAPVYRLVLEELLPAAWHCTDQYANNRIEQIMAGLRRGCDRCAASSRTATLAS
jgi:hypothetical protein